MNLQRHSSLFHFSEEKRKFSLRDFLKQSKSKKILSSVDSSTKPKAISFWVFHAYAHRKQLLDFRTTFMEIYWNDDRRLRINHPISFLSHIFADFIAIGRLGHFVIKKKNKFRFAMETRAYAYATTLSKSWYEMNTGTHSHKDLKKYRKFE